LKLPTRGEALKKMEEAGCSRMVIDHCLSVTKVAMRLADTFRQQGFEVDFELVEAGSLMHDLGRSRTHSVEHGAIGGQIARKMGLPEALTRVIERHVGAGITAQEAEKIGLPEGSYVPEKLEEKIVAYADKLLERDRLVDIEVTIDKLGKELGSDHPALDRMRALHNEMINLVGSSSNLLET